MSVGIPAPSIQYAWDGPGTLGAGQDALYMRWSNAAGRFEMASAGVSDHGGLTGLSDDDHTQYALLAGRAGGQTLNLGLNSGDAGTLNSTAHATKGSLTLGASQVLVPTGTVSAPSLTFNSDTDTGLYSVAANRVGIATGGTLRLDISATNLAYVNTSGQNVFQVTPLGVISSGITGQGITVSPVGASTIPLIVKGAASQTANLQEWQNSAGTVLASVSAAGGVLGASYTVVSAGVGALVQAGSGLAIDSWNSVTMRATIGAAQGNIGVTGTTAFIKIAGTNRILANSTGIGFFGVAPVVRPTALTAADASALNTGDATSDTVIGNMRTRIGELETKLQALGLLT